jgi:hypothetical protein
MVDEVSDGFECPFSSSHVQANESAVPQQRTKICMTFPTRGGAPSFFVAFLLPGLHPCQSTSLPGFLRGTSSGTRGKR